ncbi:bifunctional nicotinamidase/pyrazinamidase [Capnocytophaga cynodegmi]|uniref:bifunctional nicotinamidase/pyrazinamidase n=1 Tax=Capnocytophaga cynodegmi TaxID=28189 RepID=UPI001ACDB24B|nr:bifunctional nicotinamidase/pyrazinamidase [Capnocytophaga cynodegmi]GIM55479.1 nicotinamidase [Capnocytophaga cynodegmi]
MKALIIIDVQNDFMPTGALPVAEGDKIIPFINKEMQSGYDFVIATQDWHPQNHQSFASNHKGKNLFDTIDLKGVNQILWPEHCVQGTFGADLHKDLDKRPITAIFRKGMNPEIDSYSAFFDNNKLNNTGLHGFLKDKNVTELTFCGLAGDFCVAYSVNDALSLGYKVRLLKDGIRSISPKEYERYVSEWGIEQL